MTHTPEAFRESHGERLREGRCFGVTDGLGGEDWVVPFLLMRVRKGLVRGGELATELGKMGFDGGPGGEVRAAIRKMEGEGMLASSGGDRYSITEPGEAYLESCAGSLERYRKEADLFLKAYADRMAGGGLWEGRR